MSRSNQGNTLLGVLLIVLFMGTLILFPQLKLNQQHQFHSSVTASELSFPLNKKFDVISNFINKKNVSLDELFDERSQLLINFWATWCPPCLEEIPTLDYLGRQLAKKDNKDKPRLVTISIDEKSSDVIQFFKTLDASPQFIVLHDPEGDFATTLGTNKFPETFLIDRTGKVIKKWAGPENWLSGKVLQTLSFNPSH